MATAHASTRLRILLAIILTLVIATPGTSLAEAHTVMLPVTNNTGGPAHDLHVTVMNKSGTTLTVSSCQLVGFPAGWSVIATAGGVVHIASSPNIPHAGNAMPVEATAWLNLTATPNDPAKLHASWTDTIGAELAFEQSSAWAVCAVEVENLPTLNVSMEPTRVCFDNATFNQPPQVRSVDISVSTNAQATTSFWTTGFRSVVSSAASLPVSALRFQTEAGSVPASTYPQTDVAVVAPGTTVYQRDLSFVVESGHPPGDFETELYYCVSVIY